MFQPVRRRVDENRHKGVSFMLTPKLQPSEQWPCLCDPIPNRMSFVNRKYMDLCVLYFAHCQRRLQLFIVYCPVYYLTFR